MPSRPSPALTRTGPASPPPWKPPATSSPPPPDSAPTTPPRARYSTRAPRPDQPPTRRQRITEIITSQPPRDWSGRELAQLLGVKPRNMHTQLGEWAKLGF